MKDLNDIITKSVDDIIAISEAMGLKHKMTFKGINKTIISFYGINAQIFSVNTNMTNIAIYKDLGIAMRLYGRGQLKMELHNLLNITTNL